MTERKLLSFYDHNFFQEEGGGGGSMSFWKEWHILKQYLGRHSLNGMGIQCWV